MKQKVNSSRIPRVKNLIPMKRLKKYPNAQDSSFILKKIEHRIKYLKYIYNSVEFFGVEKFDKELKELDLQKKLPSEPLMEDEQTVYFSKETKKVIDIIFKICLKEYKKYDVKADDIFDRKKRLETSEARKLIVLFLIKYSGLNHQDLAMYFSRCRQIFFNIQREFIKMNKNPDKHKPFLDSYKKLDREVSSNGSVKSLLKKTS